MLESKITFNSKPVTYIPALGFNRLTPFFDSFLKWAAKEETFKPELVKQARIQKNSRVLDLGCGTATLTILIKKSQPEAEVTGIDIDPTVLEIAKEKAARAGVNIALDLGTAFKLPYQDNYFDQVVSSLMFHHLTRENKIRTLKEVLRVLKPNSQLHIADLGKPQNALMRLPSAFMGHLEESLDNVNGLFPKIFKIAGFEDIEETARIMMMFGTISLYEGRKPPQPTLSVAGSNWTKSTTTESTLLIATSAEDFLATMRK
jgi:ubiquinone/menaquinone biosynthesis C-methylase UbiE